MDKIKTMLSTYMLAGVVCETLAEVPDGFAESTIYIALGSNYDLTERLLGMLERQGAITRNAHYVRKGPKYETIRENAKQGEQAIKKILTERGIKL